jgi:non-specific serine/threonine protein kinase
MAVTYKGEMVVLGGWIPSADNVRAETSNKVFVLRSGGWVELPPMPVARSVGGAAVIGNQIYVVGGQADGQLVPQTVVFDGSTWSEAAPIPTPRDYLKAVSDGNFLYAVGGRSLDDLSKNLGTFELYEPSTGKWKKGPSMPTPRSGLGVDILNGRLFAAGGETATGALGTVEAFDVDTGSAWIPMPPLRTPRHNLAVQAVGPSLYAIDGGAVPGVGQPTKLNEVFQPQ